MHPFLIYVIIIFMKILFITDLYPIKTGEKNSVLTLHNFVFEWIKQGHKVDVIKPNFIFNSFLRGKPYHPGGFYDYERVKIFNVNYFTPFCFNIQKKIPKEFDFKNYDAVIAHMPSGIIFANKLLKLLSNKGAYSIPFVCGVHCSDIEVLTNPIYGIYFKTQLLEAYKKANKIACRSFVLQKKFSNLLPELKEKTFVAASGVNAPVSMKSHFFGKKILTCANLIRRKNIDKLIQSIKDTEFELTIIGDGKEMKYLKKISPQNVKFLGRLSHEKVLEEMRNFDIFILPSLNETFGIVYLEAMASGCIAVCSKNDAIDGIIKDSQNGFLTEPTVEGIKETLNRIKNLENIEEVIKNSLSTINNYTSENCALNYIRNIKTSNI